jgi:hypothetical protein
LFFLVIKHLWRNEADWCTGMMLALPGARKREASHIIADQARQSLTGIAAA